MIRAYRLVYPMNQHAPPQLWEWEQPCIDRLPLNAYTLDRRVVQWWFADWHALDKDNTRIWETYYRPKALYDPWPTWEDWMPEYRQLIAEVQEIYEKHRARRVRGTMVMPPLP